MDTLAKLYDTMIMNRLKLWCDVDKCQAGVQKMRGCTEQISSLKILCNYEVFRKKNKNKTLHLFMYCSKADDRVPRGRLLKISKRLVKAISAMYTCTKNVKSLQ